MSLISKTGTYLVLNRLLKHCTYDVFKKLNNLFLFLNKSKPKLRKLLH